MTNIETYTKIFTETFNVSAEDVGKLEYQAIQEWDSVGHMGLIAALEDTFEIMLDTDDIIDFSSYEKGKEILAKYNVTL
jgi:acyl carrier protein